tara:strand:- start:9 stop:248 length:240 start_codon:yes stop_codon:yes gene_type:complete
MGWNDHVDWDAERIEEIRKDKRERAQIMKDYGADEETIQVDVWDKVDVQCQGTCQGWLTKEEEESGRDMCMPCDFEAMD